MIPEDLLKAAYIGHFDRLRAIMVMKQKSYLLYREICKKTLMNNENSTDSGMQQEFAYGCQLALRLIKAINICERMIDGMAHLGTDIYI